MIARQFDFRVFEAAEELAQQTLVIRQFPVLPFWRLMLATELDFNRLYQGYVGKNVLNFFRQDHGYKSGTYVKLWAGREDKEHLLELIDGLDRGAAAFADQLYAVLTQRYHELGLGS